MQPSDPNPFADPSPVNPYSSPQAHGESHGVVAPARLAGGVTAVCVVAIILGGMGVLGSSAGLVSMLAGERMQSMLQGMQGPGIPPEANEVQQRMNESMMALLRRWVPVFLPLYLVNLGVSLLLIVGAIGVLRRTTGGFKLFTWSLWAALAYLVLYTPFNLIYTLENARIAQQFMPEMMRAAGPQGAAPPAGAEQLIQTTMTVAMIFSVARIVIWNLAQGIFYLFSVFYLKRRWGGVPTPALGGTA